MATVKSSSNNANEKTLAKLRNMGIIAHIDAGKTTLSERILFYSDVIHRMGEVHEGAATMDFMPEEQERGITITSACITCSWKGHSINLVDTPGHVDFTIEVERSLRVLDGAVGVFCAVGGVEPQSETVWRQATAFGIPRLAVVNKIDRPGASYRSVLESMSLRLGARPAPVTIPLGEGEDFIAVLDVISEERIDFDPSTQGREFKLSPMTDQEKKLAAPFRESLLDALTEKDDELLEICLAGDKPSPERIRAALRTATLERRVVPVFAASALRNIGVQPVLDAIIDYLPSPLEASPALAVEITPKEHLALTAAAKAAAAQSARESGKDSPKSTPARLIEEFAPTAEREKVIVDPDPKAPVSALVFKVALDAGRKVAFARVYAGTITEGAALSNATRGGEERVSRLFRIQAGRREQLKEALAGDIVALQGLKNINSGDSLADRSRLILLENIKAYNPVISLAFEPKNVEEGKSLDEALANFCVEDPTISVDTSEATGQRIVSGMGELHLEVLCNRLEREYNLKPRVGNPQVVCRETIQAKASAIGEFDRELGEQPHYGKAAVTAERLPMGQGVLVETKGDFTGFSQPLIEAAVKGMRDACYSGPNGHPVDDLILTLERLERKNSLATAPGCHMAAQAAARAAIEKASPVVLEPIMTVDISVPEEFLGPVISLLGARCAKVENIEDRSGIKLVRSKAPMRGLFGFATSLRSATQGRAGPAMRFSHYGQE